MLEHQLYAVVQHLE